MFPFLLPLTRHCESTSPQHQDTPPAGTAVAVGQFPCVQQRRRRGEVSVLVRDFLLQLHRSYRYPSLSPDETQNTTEHEFCESRFNGAVIRLGGSCRRLLRGFGRASGSRRRVRF